MFVNWFMYIWNEAKWGKKLLEKYWNNYYFSSFHHKWPDSIAPVHWGQRQQRPFLCSFVATQGAKLLLHTKGTREKSRERWGQAYQKVGSVTQVPLGWQAVILRKDGGGGASGFLSPLDYTVQWSSQQETGDAACPFPTPHVVSVGDQLLTREQPPQIELKQRAASIHHESSEGQAKVPSLAFHQLFLPLTPAVPKSWCQPWQAQGLWQWQVWWSTKSTRAHQEAQGFTVGLGEQVINFWNTTSSQAHGTADGWLDTSSARHFYRKWKKITNYTLLYVQKKVNPLF